jgi:aryl-alcohol dehydrogenase-like predicted oxidoreductase
VPIPGTSKLHRLEENLGGANLRLTRDDIRDIGHAFAGIAVEGERYPPELQKMVGR